MNAVTIMKAIKVGSLAVSTRSISGVEEKYSFSRNDDVGLKP